jgi:nucleoside-diphosphate-sugar epimerase
VTGATGFAGSQLTKRLLTDGFDVRVLVRPQTNPSFLSLLGAEIASGDVTDMDSVKRAVEEIDTVYHVAALFREAKFPDDTYWAVNYEGAMNVLRAAHDAGVQRFVHCSTVGVLGNIENPPATEEAPYNPGDVYQRSKCRAEQDVLKFHKETGFPVSIVRPAAIYGPGDRRWLKLFRSVGRQKFMMIGTGETLIHFIYISDLVEMFRLASDSPKAVGQVYIAADDRYVSLNELVATIASVVNVQTPKTHIPVAPVRLASGLVEDVCRALHVEPPIFRRRVDFFVKNRAFDITKAKTELGFKPSVSMQEGIRRTTDWYQEHNLL